MEYLEILHRMYVDDASHVSVEEMSVDTWDVNAYFAAGNIYMMINGDWTFLCWMGMNPISNGLLLRCLCLR